MPSAGIRTILDLHCPACNQLTYELDRHQWCDYNVFTSTKYDRRLEFGAHHAVLSCMPICMVSLLTLLPPLLPPTCPLKALKALTAQRPLSPPLPPPHGCPSPPNLADPAQLKLLCTNIKPGGGCRQRVQAGMCCCSTLPWTTTSASASSAPTRAACQAMTSWKWLAWSCPTLASLVKAKTLARYASLTLPQVMSWQNLSI